MPIRLEIAHTYVPRGARDVNIRRVQKAEDRSSMIRTHPPSASLTYLDSFTPASDPPGPKGN